MKWVCTRPLVDQPQTKKVTINAQKTHVRLASRSTRSAERTGEIVGGAMGSASGVPGTAPYGIKPMSCGRSRMKSQITSAVSSARTETMRAAARHPGPSAVAAMAGRKSNWPVAFAPEKTPTTSPRRATNQRLATIAPSTSAVEPVAVPITTPHKAHNCQVLVITVVAAEAAATTANASETTMRGP